MVTDWVEETDVVVMLNDGEVVAPAAMVTLAGTVTLGLPLASATDTPPAGAGALSKTLLLPVTATPPTTDGGDSVMEESVTVPAGATVKVDCMVTPLYVA